MFELVDLFDAVLLYIQQFGVIFAVCAEITMLSGYIVSMRDGTLTEAEIRFSKLVHRALGIGLIIIISSGVAITAIHSTVGQVAIVLTPVFLFKWLLIVVLAGAYLMQRKKQFPHYALEGLLGGTWFVFFLIHILGPDLSWIDLLGFYVVGAGAFTCLWVGLVFMLHAKPSFDVPGITILHRREVLACLANCYTSRKC